MNKLVTTSIISKTNNTFSDIGKQAFNMIKDKFKVKDLNLGNLKEIKIDLNKATHPDIQGLENIELNQEIQKQLREKNRFFKN